MAHVLKKAVACCLPSEGWRLTVTLFTPRSFHRLQVHHWRLLHDLGFSICHLLKLVLEGKDRALVQDSPGCDAQAHPRGLRDELLPKEGVSQPRCASRGRPPPTVSRVRCGALLEQLFTTAAMRSDFWHFFQVCQRLVCLALTVKHFVLLGGALHG